jgi:RNA polymerase sigma-70 factor (ECF subfamily)
LTGGDYGLCPQYRESMTATATTGNAGPAAEEARLARSAAAGDASAFTTLYERYEQRVFNLAHRITGSQADAADATQEAFLRTTMRELPKSQDGEPAFALCLFTATRHACHDLMELRRPTEPGESMPMTPDEDVREANMRLPEHQREALALRELEQLSYGEIAAILETSPDSVGKLLSRARINLSDDLHGTTLAAVAAPSAACERALPLIAAREDGQLEARSEDDAWLNAHLTGCERCALAVQAMNDAGASYRAWAPIAALPWLLEETMAKAAALAGVDWSVEIAAGIASRTGDRPTSVMGQAELSSRGGEGRPSRGRRRAIAAAGLAALLLGGGVAAAMLAGGPTQVSPRLVAATYSADSSGGSNKTHPKQQGQKPGSHKNHKSAQTDTTTPEATTLVSPPPAIESGGGGAGETAASPGGHHEVSGIQSPQATGTPEPKHTPKPAPQPAPAPAPPAETQAPVEPVAEEAAPQPPSKGKAKGKEKGPPPGH